MKSSVWIGLTLLALAATIVLVVIEARRDVLEPATPPEPATPTKAVPTPAQPGAVEPKPAEPRPALPPPPPAPGEAPRTYGPPTVINPDAKFRPFTSGPGPGPGIEPTGVPEVDTNTAVRTVEWFKKTDLTRKRLLGELAKLARGTDEESVRTLLALTQDPGFAIPAIEATVDIPDPAVRARVAGEMRNRMADSNMSVVCAAVGSYAALNGDAAVPELVAFIQQNWRRPDGYGEQVCAATAKAMGELRSPAGDAGLIGELQRGAVEPGWLPDYGSVVVAALAKPKQRVDRRDPRGFVVSTPPQPMSPEVRASLQAYAEYLARKMPGPDNPPGRKYYEEKIAEVRAALEPPKEEPKPEAKPVRPPG